MSAPLRQSVDELALALAQIKGVSVDDALRFLGGKGFSSGVQANLMARGAEASRLGRFATGRLAGTALRAVPLVGTAMTALDAADIVTNNTSLGNKAMDAAAMGIGGAIGAWRTAWRCYWSKFGK